MLNNFIKHKNIYFGRDSLLKVDPLQGKPDKVDTIDDFLAVMYALFLDGMNHVMLTHYEKPPYIAVVRFNPKTFAGRVYILHRLLGQNHLLRKAPNLKKFVEEMTDLIMRRHISEAYRILEDFANTTGTYDLFQKIANALQQIKQRPKIYIG